jgi:hypothetical protein
MTREWHQGIYTPINKIKYIGSKEPVFRSSWERRVFHWMDHNKNVVAWSSETIKIHYFFPLDNKNHIYYPDIYCEVIGRDDQKKIWLIEIKPLAQSVMPKPPKLRTSKSIRNYRMSQIMVKKNEFKWGAAELYCKKRNWKFKVITEQDIFPM